MKRVVSIILGGGEGKRLFPLTATRAKPAVPFSRYRLIDIPLSNSLNSNIRKIFIVTQFLSFSLHQHLIKTYHLDSFSAGFIEVLAPEQKPSKNVWFQGTADAVRQNLEYFSEVQADYFLILAGDQLYNMDFQEMLLLAQEQDADLTIASIAVDAEAARRLGIFHLDGECRPIGFVEKPPGREELEPCRMTAQQMQRLGLRQEPGREFLGSMGIYIFKRQALFRLLQEDQREDFGKHLIPHQIAQGKVAVYPYQGYWEDIGTIDSFYRASLELTDPVPRFNCYDETHLIYTAPNYLPGPKIAGTRVTRSIISEGSLIDAEEITHSILGARSVVRQGVVIRDSVLMGNDFYTFPSHEQGETNLPLEIGAGSHIERAIIDKNVHIGKNVQLVNKNGLNHYDGEGIYIRDGIIIVARGASLPDGFML